jgi:protein-S-isoprenylcysteine O-methyltransferase Ste14
MNSTIRKVPIPLLKSATRDNVGGMERGRADREWAKLRARSRRPVIAIGFIALIAFSAVQLAIAIAGEKSSGSRAAYVLLLLVGTVAFGLMIFAGVTARRNPTPPHWWYWRGPWEVLRDRRAARKRAER